MAIIYCYLFSGCGKAQTEIIDDKTEIKLEPSEFQIEASSLVKIEECCNYFTYDMKEDIEGTEDGIDILIIYISEREGKNG